MMAHTWVGSVCQECETDISWCDNPPKLAPTGPPEKVKLTLGPNSLDYRVGEIVWHQTTNYRVESVLLKHWVVLKRVD